MRQYRTQVAVVGAGPAGLCAASTLQQAGLDVLVLEAAHFPRFALGGSLQPRCLDLLEDCGLQEALASVDGLVKTGTVLFADDVRCRLDLRDRPLGRHTHALQVQRGRFDQALAETLERRGVTILWAHRVVGGRGAPAPRVMARSEQEGGAEISADFVVDASGSTRALGQHLGVYSHRAFENRVAVYGWVPDPQGRATCPGDSWILAHPQGPWAWVTPFADGTASLGVVGDVGWFLSRPIDPRLCLDSAVQEMPELRQRFGHVDVVEHAARTSCWSRRAHPVSGPGWCLVGAAAGFVDPIFSTGVTGAVVTGVLAARLIARQLGGEAVPWAEAYGVPLRKSQEVKEAVVGAWYDGMLGPQLIRESIVDRNMHPIWEVICGISRELEAALDTWTPTAAPAPP